MCVHTTLPSMTMSIAESAADSDVQTSKRKGIIMTDTKQTQDLIFIFKDGVAVLLVYCGCYIAQWWPCLAVLLCKSINLLPTTRVHILNLSLQRELNLRCFMLEINLHIQWM